MITKNTYKITKLISFLFLCFWLIVAFVALLALCVVFPLALIFIPFVALLLIAVGVIEFALYKEDEENDR